MDFFIDRIWLAELISKIYFTGYKIPDAKLLILPNFLSASLK
jgi:hypothetical protein